MVELESDCVVILMMRWIGRRYVGMEETVPYLQEVVQSRFDVSWFADECEDLDVETANDAHCFSD